MSLCSHAPGLASPRVEVGIFFCTRAMAALPDEPPAGWRRPHYWEPQGGLVRDDAGVSSPPERSMLDYFSCSAPRRPGEGEEEEWSLYKEVQEWFCGVPQRPAPDEDDEAPIPADTDQKFAKVALKMARWKPSTLPSDEERLAIYALYKQANYGRATGDPPSPLDPVGRAKFDAWARLGAMSRGRAKIKYIAEAERQMGVRYSS